MANATSTKPAAKPVAAPTSKAASPTSKAAKADEKAKASSSSNKNRMSIKPCTCAHEYQDKKFGKGQRAHNPCKKGTDQVGHRCTVCGSEK